MLIHNNTNITVRNNQVFSKDILNSCFQLGGRLPATFQNVDCVQLLSGMTIKIFKNMVYRFLGHNEVFVSHAYLAAKVGCNIRTVQRAQKDLVAAGLLKVESGKVAHVTNRYQLGDIVFNQEFIYRLREVIPCLRFVIAKLTGKVIEFCNSMQGLLVQKPNVGRITNVKDFNTSLYIDNSYSKGRLPFVPKEIYKNMMKIMWLDWSLTLQQAYAIAFAAYQNILSAEKLKKARQQMQEFKQMYDNPPQDHDHFVKVIEQGTKAKGFAGMLARVVFHNTICQKEE